METQPSPLARLGGPLGVLLVLGLLVAGCGSSASDAAPDSPGSSSSSAATGTPTTLTIVSATGAGGSVKPQAVPLGTASAISGFLAQFRGPSIATQLTTALRTVTVPTGQAVYAAVIAVGCDVPPGADVVGTDGQVFVTPQEVASPRPECLAPVTSVALVSVPVN